MSISFVLERISEGYFSNGIKPPPDIALKA